LIPLAVREVNLTVSSQHARLCLLPFSLDRDAVGNNKTGTLRELAEKMSVQSVEVASAKLIDIIDNSTREKEGGEFVTVDGERIPW
jgi:hypothetical protein